MAAGFFIAAAVVSVVGGLQARNDANRAASDQHAVDTQAADLAALETEETINQQLMLNQRTEATGRTQVGASGFRGGSSLDSYIQTLEAEHTADIDWMRTSGASRQDLMAEDADARRSQTESQGRAALWSGIGQGLGFVGMSW